MRFLADESCDFAVVRALRKAGFEVETVRDLAPGASDEFVVHLAVSSRSVLLTEDRDFGRLVLASAETSTGVCICASLPTLVRNSLRRCFASSTGLGADWWAHLSSFNLAASASPGGNL